MNESVGNDWVHLVRCNESVVYSGDQIIPSDSGYYIQYTVFERDAEMDVGRAILQFSPDGGTQSAQIVIVEDRGRYAGNHAVWEFECTVEKKP